MFAWRRPQDGIERFTVEDDIGILAILYLSPLSVNAFHFPSILMKRRIIVSAYY